MSGEEGVDASLYPIAVLIDELRHDDLQLRLNSIRSLGTIAKALGPERTRDELLPFLQEITDDDDEALIALAEQLGSGVDWVGGPAHAHTLTGPLEELCNVEEINVREKATEALRLLAKDMSPDQVFRHFRSLIGRLAQHDWFTSRISVCNLFSAALQKVPEAKQDDILKTYFRVCSDDTPMVRRQAANVLGNIAEVLRTDTAMMELLEVFEKLAKDEQDSVRILAIQNCIALGRRNVDATWQARILRVIKACTEDKSWRVRYMVADNVRQLCEVFKDSALSDIIPMYLRLLQDPEVEVRTVSAARIAAVASINPTKEFLASLMPMMEKLALPREHSQHVRASLAGAVLGLTPIFGPQLTVDYLINIFLLLIRDESPDVRLRLIGTLGELATVLSINVLSQSLLPSIKELGKDRQWRVRLAIIESMPQLAGHLGEVEFTRELNCLFLLWLVDPVFSVRGAAAINFKKLSEVLGMQWCETNVVPQLQSLLTHKNYLYRISAILCAGALAEVATGPFLETLLVPMVVKMSSDPVANVRFNTAKAIMAMHQACTLKSPGVFNDHLIPCLRRLATDQDLDVKFFAQKALTEVGQ